MTGEFFKKWVEKTYERPEQIASDLGVCLATIYKWTELKKIRRLNVLALMTLGCVDPKEQISFLKREKGA